MSLEEMLQDLHHLQLYSSRETYKLALEQFITFLKYKGI